MIVDVTEPSTSEPTPAPPSGGPADQSGISDEVVVQLRREPAASEGDTK